MTAAAASRVSSGIGGRLSALTTFLLSGQVVSVVVWGLALGLLNVLTVISYPAFKDTIGQTLSGISPQMRALFGIASNGTTIESWLAINTFDLIAPLALSFYPILLGARAIAGREDSQSMDLLMSNPIPRWALVAATAVTMGVSLLAILFVFGLLTWVPTLLIGVDLSVGAAAAAVLNLWPLCMFLGTLALLCSAVFRRVALAIGIPAAVLLAMYIVEALGSASHSLDALRHLSLFYYYDSAIEHGIPWGAFAAISVLDLAITGLAALAFQRRDIYA